MQVCALQLCSSPTLMHVGNVQLMIQGFPQTFPCTLSLKGDKIVESSWVCAEKLLVHPLSSSSQTCAKVLQPSSNPH